MTRRERAPWTAVVAGIVPPLYCFASGLSLVSMGEVQDFGDMGAVGMPLIVIGLVELLLSFGVGFGSRWCWWAAVVAHGAVVPVLMIASAAGLGTVWAYATCMVVPAALALPFLLLSQTRRWCVR